MPFVDATLVVEGNRFRLDAKVNYTQTGITINYIVNFEGDYKVEYKPLSESLSNLTSDVEIDLSNCTGKYKCYGDNWKCGFCNWYFTFEKQHCIIAEQFQRYPAVAFSCERNFIGRKISYCFISTLWQLKKCLGKESVFFIIFCVLYSVPTQEDTTRSNEERIVPFSYIYVENLPRSIFSPLPSTNKRRWFNT